MHDLLEQVLFSILYDATKYAGDITARGWSVHESLRDHPATVLVRVLTDFKEVVDFKGSLEQFCKTHDSLGLGWESDKKIPLLTKIEGFKNENLKSLIEWFIFSRVETALTKEFPKTK